MKYLWLLVPLLFGTAAQAQTMEQHTEGWCSPAVAATKGNVTIICQGVDPKALARLNELLDKKDLELKDKIREAEDWARKYRDLSQRLAEEGQDSELARRARTLSEEGKLEEAGALLDRLLASGEEQVERIASQHFSRALIFDLQFKPLEALPHYAKAYQYRLENAQYARAYADVLQEQKQYREAEPIYGAALRTYRKLAQDNPAAYLPDVAATLNNLGNLYRDTQRLKEAEESFREALTLRRKLAEDNPAAYLPDVAMTLANSAILALQDTRIEQAQKWVEEALTIRREL